ncbi:hypothetical protein MMC25_006473 [Agyrium rufum]|nr:hypothetical protein [Agyrium rufum]
MALSLFQPVFSVPVADLFERASAIPSYVITYAPIVYLDTQEKYFPSDIGAQLPNTVPEVNFTKLTGYATPLTLNSLNELNADGGKSVYLTSTSDITKSPAPAYLNGVVPDSSGKTNGAVSCAIIVNDHGSGHVDAFYMYFYAYNEGNTVLGQEIGDHVGDWEHNMIRFLNGVPQQVWYSQHNNGEAFTYGCLNKVGVRPIAYSARGSHAVYATSGTHDHTIPDLNLPVGPVEDNTSQGALWDPTLSAYTYSYNVNTNTYTPYVAGTPTNWLYFTGEWGDQQYPTSDPRQKEILGISATAKYTGGPTGPEDKQLNRTQVCPDNGDVCIVSPVLRP